MCMIRLVADTCGISSGGAAHVGSDGEIVWSRSCTSWRAARSWVPGLNHSVIADSCGTDSERIVSSRGTPPSAFSSGTVTSDSTSEADSPRQAV